MPPSFSAFRRCIVFFLFIVLRPASSVLTNRTIDDQYGDSVTGVQPLYEGTWSYGPTCPDCSAHPSAERAFMSSWHDTTTLGPSHRNQIVTLVFTGVAVWVYCIVPNYIPSTITLVNISLILDGEVVGNYLHEPDTTGETYLYNVTVYSSTGLTNMQHTLVMMPMQDPNSTLLLFDWAEYTYYNDGDEASAPAKLSSSSSSSIAAATASTTAFASMMTSVTQITPTSGTTLSLSSMQGVSSSSPVLNADSTGDSIATVLSAQNENTAGTRLRTILIGTLVGGGGTIAVVLLTVALAYQRFRRRKALHRIGRNTLQRATYNKTSILKVEPFMDQSPTSQRVLRAASIHSTSHRRSTSTRNSLHVSSLGSSMVVSVNAPATVGGGDSEVVRPNPLEEAKEEEQFIRRVRKFRDQVADLRRWAEQGRPSQRAPAHCV